MLPEQKRLPSSSTMPASSKRATSRNKNLNATRKSPAQLVSTALLIAANTTGQPIPSNQDDGRRGGHSRLPDRERKHAPAPPQPRATSVLPKTTDLDELDAHEAGELPWDEDANVPVETVSFPSPTRTSHPFNPWQAAKTK